MASKHHGVMSHAFRRRGSGILVGVCVCRWGGGYLWGFVREYLGAFVCVTLLIHIRSTAHSCMTHDAIIPVTRLMRKRNVDYPFVLHDSFKCFTRLLDVTTLARPQFLCEPYSGILAHQHELQNPDHCLAQLRVRCLCV